MANSEAGSSSDPARALGGEYQVFLNFRGPDTRHGFTDFLYCDLLDAGVRVFRDEDELRVGEVIGGNLLRAINNSMIYIPIFSVTYASSKWCLRELAHIIDNVSQSEGKKSILPIFFHVKPDDVKLKTPLYKNTLLEHEEKFPVEVKAWRKALKEVDEIKGWSVKEDQSQATIVKLVVKRVLEKLKLKQRLVPEHLVGLDDRVKHLTEFLNVNHLDVRLIGIYGMGGIGKTTVAKVIFNELLSHFGKYSSFLENVREKMSTEEGKVQLQKKLLSDIGDSGSAEVKDSEQGMRGIGEVLRNKKVLVVLDDADNKDHIKKLIGNNLLHLGSRIIITTRNKAILQGQEFNGEIMEYEMLKMDDALAIQLFCWHAFGRDFPLDGYHELSSKIVSSIGGLPLAIKVIGSLLNGKDKPFWEETLIKLRNVPEEEILKKLRISYEHLDEYQQQIFLDIACFFFNEKKTNAIYMWAGCQFYPVTGIDVLINRCLIKILDNDKFWMHDQLIDMGRRIVHQESPSDLGNRSRLWIAKEALEIIRTEERKNKVQALQVVRSLDVYTRFIEITSEEFERFPNLRFLKLHGGTFVGDFAKCHSKLKWISWESPCGFNSDFMADNMYFNDLLVIKFGNNIFKDDSKAWELIKRAGELKVLSLMGCDGITTIPNFSKCLKLERFTLANCKSLKRIESFIGKLQFLIELEIKGCVCLTDLPEEVGALRKLQRFSLWGCGLRELPCSLKNLTLLEELVLWYNQIQELPELPTSLTCLVFEFKSLRLVPNLSNLTNLVELQLVGGSVDTMETNLVTGCNLSWIGRLFRLEKLNLKLLNVPVPLELASLSRLKELVLMDLDLRPLTQFLSSDWSGRNLSTLRLRSCGVRDIRLVELPRLEHFTVSDCGLLKGLSISSGLTQLRLVDVRGCRGLVEIRVESLSKSLEGLSIESCDSLERITGLSCLKNMKNMLIWRCRVLTDVEGLDKLEYLKSLMVTDCKSLRRLIDAYRTKIPDDCTLSIGNCGNLIKDSGGMRSKYYRKMLRNSSNKGKRRTVDDQASDTNTPTKNSTCGQGSGIPQHVTRRTRRQAAKIQPPVEEAALPVEAVGPSRKRKKNNSKQVNPIRSARLMKGATGGTADVVHID